MSNPFIPTYLLIKKSILSRLVSYKKKHLTHQLALKDLPKHETKRHVLIKFILVLLLFSIYLLFVIHKFGIQQGIFVTILTWSFFVLCTPIADAGFIIDFPLRLITQIRMFHAEMIVWGIAISLNLYTFFLHPIVYTKTNILTLFFNILARPFPFWGIIAISLVGTFISIHFGDELLDKIKYRDRKSYQKYKHAYQFIIMVFVFTMAIVMYDILLKKLGIDLPI